MAQNVTATSAARLCKRVVYEHTRTVRSVFLVPDDAGLNELDFEFNEGDTKLCYRGGILMPRVALEPYDDEYRPYDKWGTEEEVHQELAKLDDKTFEEQVADDLAELEQKSKATPKVGEKRVHDE